MRKIFNLAVNVGITIIAAGVVISSGRNTLNIIGDILFPKK